MNTSSENWYDLDEILTDLADYQVETYAERMQLPVFKATGNKGYAAALSLGYVAATTGGKVTNSEREAISASVGRLFPEASPSVKEALVSITFEIAEQLLTPSAILDPEADLSFEEIEALVANDDTDTTVSESGFVELKAIAKKIIGTAFAVQLISEVGKLAEVGEPSDDEIVVVNAIIDCLSA